MSSAGRTIRPYSKWTSPRRYSDTRVIPKKYTFLASLTERDLARRESDRPDEIKGDSERCHQRADVKDVSAMHEGEHGALATAGARVSGRRS